MVSRSVTAQGMMVPGVAHAPSTRTARYFATGGVPVRNNGGIGRRFVAAAVSGLLVLGLGTAAVAAPADEKLASDDPVNNTPHVLDNRAYAVAQVGSRVVVGGNFMQIQPSNGGAVQNQPNLFAFDAATGTIDPNFKPDVNGEIKAIIPHPDGNKVYVAGQFSRINNEQASRVALLNLVDGQLVSSFTPLAINAEVNDIKLRGQRLYLGGDFSSMGPSDAPIVRKNLAALNADTGALLGRTKFNIAGTNSGGTTDIRKIDVTPDGSKLVAIGNFTSVNGQARSQIATFNTTGQKDTLRAWSTTKYGNVCNPVFDSYMRDVDFSPDGKFFIVVTTGSYRFGQLCDTAARWTTNANQANRVPTWASYSGGDTFTSIEITGPIAYLGGHMRWVNNPFAGDKAGAGAVPREGLAALDTRNGLPFSWDPTRARGYGVFDFYPTDTTVWATSDTNIWHGETRQRLAGFPFAGGVTLPPDRIGSLPGEVLLLGRLQAPNVNKLNVIAFDGSAVSEVTPRPGSEAWSNARGAFMVDNQVFTGWANGTFKVRTFNGQSWGTPANIPLYAGDASTPGYPSNFVNDVSKLTGIFYEPTDSRIYYTMAGDTRVMWRDFTPESRVVGAQRNFVGGGSAISPANVRGMFLVGTDLYYAENSTGRLKRIGFEGGKFVGSPTNVNNSIDWRAPGMALSTQPTSTGPNTDPIADFTSNCIGLSCSFDGSTSTDPDGLVISYQWDFGDGTQDSGDIVNHNFATAGDYDVTLTVTDNRGGVDTFNALVSVEPIASTVAFRASTKSADGDNTNSLTISIPGPVEVGDTMLLFASNGLNGIPQAPPGWTLLDTRTDDELRSDVFWKVATVDDIGQEVTVSLLDGIGDPVSASSTLHLAAYSGVGTPPVSTYDGLIEGTTFTSDHSTPGVTVPVDGSWVVSYWTDRTTTTVTPPVTPTSDWGFPAGQVGRGQVINTANNARVTALLTDDGTPAVAGPRDGLLGTTNSSTRKAIGWTIVLAPS